jgi:hypothetical protein
MSARRTVLVREAINNASLNRFRWGKLDCCLFAADVVRSYTGIDYAYEYRDAYGTREQSYKIINQHGSIKEMVTNLLGIEPIAQPIGLDHGDLALVEMPLIVNSPIVGVIFGDMIVMKGKRKMHDLPIDAGICYWHVESDNG